MDNIYLGLAIHNHQPVDNFGWVLEEAYQKAYFPFVQALERHPRIRLSLHYSGCLLDWLQKSHPDFLGRVAALAGRGQVELMTGGYYEPILPVIPDADKVGQVVKLSRFIRERFGQVPEGLWLAERVWEPHLPKVLAQAGVRWTVVDDTHFKLAGLGEEALGGYYMTEEEGQALKVFPSSKRLRYLIPWKSVPEVMAHLRGLAEAGCSLAAMGDDGEKFGVWPKTYEHCWEKGWIEEFFTALEEAPWLQTIPLGEYARLYPPLGTIYLPTASYDEMMEWVLPTPAREELERLTREMKDLGREDVLAHLRGSFWRNFLAKYPEANAMHKKMLQVHRKVHRALARGQSEAGLEELWKGQCNCAYWHGVFGGLYLDYMRRSVYHHLILAENAAEGHLHPSLRWLRWRRLDYDADGHEELLVEGHLQNLYLHPAQGGCLGEWDMRRPGVNLIATLARRPEAYHRALAKMGASQEKGPPAEEVKTIHELQRAKETGLSRLLIYDRHRRACLIDHFLAAGATPESFADSTWKEMGDFPQGAYESQVKARKGSLALHLRRQGQVRHTGANFPLLLDKELRLEAGREALEVTFRLSGGAPLPQEALAFGSEWNLALSPRGHETATVQRFGSAERQPLISRGECRGVKALFLQDPYLGLELTVELEPAATLWRFPVETVSSSEEGFERTFQGSCFLFLWPWSGAFSQEFAMAWHWKAIP